MSDAESTMESESLNQPKQQEDQKPRSLPSLALWPPTQRTRDAVVTRLIETLSTPSPLSKRYGVLSADDAADVARLIEEDAFASAGGSAAATEEDGIQILQVYSKEISKRMLDTVKNRNAAAAAAASTAPPDTGSSAVDDVSAAVAGLDVKADDVEKEEP